MERWSFAPRGSDDALDARGVFLDYVGSLNGVDKYFLDKKNEKARSIFNSLTLQEIDNFLENEPTYIVGYRFVIPYVYLEYEAFDVSIEIKEKLKYYDLIHSRQADYLSGESDYPLYDGTSSEYLSPGEIFLPRFSSP